jgi:hypothetical protein
MVQAANLSDFVLSTLKDLGPPKFQQIAQPLQSYPVLSQWLKKKKVKFGSGNGIQRNLMTQISNQAGHVGLLDEDSYDIPDLMVQMSIPWRHAQSRWGFIYQTDVLMNRGKSLIFNVVEPRRADALISLAKVIEAGAWTAPAVADVNDPYGVPYWIVYNSTDGFTGGTPSDHTTVAGVNLDDNPNFKNYSYTYTDVSKSDLIRNMRTVHRKIDWRSPISIDDYRKGTGRDLQLYTNESRILDLEEIGEAQNENLGRDLASVEAGTGQTKGDASLGHVDMQLVFRRHPILWVPHMDDTSVFTTPANPVYMIDHRTFYPVCLRGDYLRESEVEKVPNQHNLYRVFLDLSYNFINIDRRRNAVLATGS